MRKSLILLLLPVLLVDCGHSSYITSSWRIKGESPRSYKKIVVLAVTGEKNQPLRESMEQHIADDLKTTGFNAVCSCNEYNRSVFANLNEQQALEKLRGFGVEAVLTVVMLGKADERYYVPARANVPGQEGVPNRFWDYYQSVHSLIGTDGYYVTGERFFWESNLYDMASGKLLYSAKSQSFDPGSADELGHEYGKVIIKNMVKKRVIQKLQ